jgi:TetR/AcrR family transcriptional repressor of nem operon
MSRQKDFEPQQIIQKAMMLFWEKGYTATSVDDLVTHLNLNRSSLYHTFGGKHELFMLTLETYSQQIISGVAQILETSPSVKEAFGLICTYTIENTPPMNQWGCLMVNSITELLPHDEKVAMLAESYTHTLHSLILAKLQQDMEAERVPIKSSPTELAFFLFNTLQGLKVMLKTGSPRASLYAVRDITLTLLV